MKDRGGIVLLPLDETEQAFERLKKEAMLLAQTLTKHNGRKFVVREDVREEWMLFVVPLYVAGSEDKRREAVFSELGPIIEESLDGPPSSKPKTANVG